MSRSSIRLRCRSDVCGSARSSSIPSLSTLSGVFNWCEASAENLAAGSKVQYEFLNVTFKVDARSLISSGAAGAGSERSKLRVIPGSVAYTLHWNLYKLENNEAGKPSMVTRMLLLRALLEAEQQCAEIGRRACQRVGQISREARASQAEQGSWKCHRWQDHKRHDNSRGQALPSVPLTTTSR